MSLRRITLSLLLSVSQLAATGYLRAQQPAPPTPKSPTPTAAPSQPGRLAAQTGGAIHGSVKSGPVPLPGVSITATNTLTGKKYSTATDARGDYSMTIPSNGRYVLRTDLAGFAPTTQEALLNAASHDQKVDFSLTLASRAAQEEQQQTAAAQPASTPDAAPKASPSPTLPAALSKLQAAQRPRPQPSPRSPQTLMSPPNPSPSPARMARPTPLPASTSAMAHRARAKATQPSPVTPGVPVALALPAEVAPVDTARAEEASAEEAALGDAEAAVAALADAAISATSIPINPTAHSSGMAATRP